MTLSDTHLVLLSAAARHELQLLLRPETMADRTAARLAGRLTTAGLVEAVPVKPDQPHWSVNAEGEAVGLRITAAGLAAIGVGEESAAAPVQEEQGADGGQPACEEGAAEQGAAAEPTRSPAPRPGSKQALLVSLLGQEGGASIEALRAATGWLPHTVRAALTGLRQKGYSLGKARDEAGVTHYRLNEPSGEASTPDAERAEKA